MANFFRIITGDIQQARFLSQSPLRHIKTTYTLVTAPSIEPVTLSETKDFVGVTDDSSDTIIKNLIKCARQWAEDFTSITFISQEWSQRCDDLPPSIELILDKAPLISVETISSFDDANTETTFAASNYVVDADSERTRGRIYLNNGSIWPTDLRDRQMLRAQYSSGFGPAASDVPQAIKEALKFAVQGLYNGKDECDDCSEFNIAKKKLRPYKLMDMF